jgi:hypothetical protein
MVVTYGLVPAWLLAGALTKLADLSPLTLPVILLQWLGPTGIDLGFVLRFAIAAELTVVVVIWLLPRLARLVSLVMLGAFLPILAGDLFLGAASCGCFGSVELHPGVTLILDLGLFLGVLILGRGVEPLMMPASLPTRQTLAAGLATIAMFAVAFGRPAPTRTETAAAPEVAASTVALPASGYYMPDYNAWLGQPFTELDIASWITGLPPDLAEGQQYLLFYRKDCEHCHELMEVYFSSELPLPTTAVAVPERDGFPEVGLTLPCADCRTAQLPAGVDWFMQTPVLVRITDGVVDCAAEVSPLEPECLY